MKNYFQKLSLNTINLFGTIVLFLFIMLFTLLVIFQEYRDFEKESLQLRQNYLESQKLKAKDETLRVLNYIHYFYQEMQAQMSDEKLKESIIRSIEHLFDRKSGSSYIFIYTAEGVNVSDPNKLYNRGKNLIGFQDPKGKYVIKELIEEALKGGGYVEYMWDNPVTKKTEAKISYAALFEKWDWMIGTGVYLEEIEKIIEKSRQKHKERLLKYVATILAFSLFLFFIAYLVIRMTNKVIGKEMASLKDFFKEAVTHTIVIDKQQIRMGEFQILAGYVNEMVEAIHERNAKLKELNLSLEEKVARKTAKLQKQIEYNKQLVNAQDSFIKQSIHEVNTPLAVIMTHIDIYTMKYGENRYLKKIEAASKMISTIYEDLSYMVKRDRLTYEKEWIDIKAYLLSRVKFFEEIALGNEHTVQTELRECGKIWFNELELQRVIDNNLSNAIKYAKRGTDITVELYQEREDIIMRFITCSKKIEDTQKIFEPFHREDEIESGFGLGLEIVGAICKKENVGITVKSDEQITVFSYRFKYKGEEEPTKDEGEGFSVKKDNADESTSS